MKINYLLLILMLSMQLIADEIVLNGNDLTIDQIVAMSKDRPKVRIDPVAMERVIQSHQLLLDAAKEDKPVYGLNRGVGLNKDKTLFEGALLNEDAKQASIAFNKRNLRATSAAVGPELPAKIVFPILMVKLNSILHGTTGAQPEVASMLLEMINQGIQPVIPGTGSMGEADITILSHIGLAMIGEGEVYYQGKKMAASQALELAHLKPLLPLAKDSLSIMSSNAYSSALAALLINDIEQLVDKADAVFSLSLEGLNGNVAPYLEEVQNARPFEGQRISAKNIRYLLDGSYLFSPSEERELQDPLSFRSVSQTHGAVRDQLKRAKTDLMLHFKSSDDNPIVQLYPEVIPNGDQERAYYLKNQNGAVIPTANFETINLAVDIEALAISLSHLSHASVQRMLRLSSEKFTHLTRFLTPDPQAIVFGAAQKSF